MELTRRRFLECASGALAMVALPGVSRPLALRIPPDERSVGCALLDLEEECGIAESIAGYESALAQLGVSAVHADARSAPGCAMLIVPAALRVSPATGKTIRRSLASGATVILESGAGFTDPDGADFRAHRDSLRDELQLHVGSPVALWPRPIGAGGIPYVDYSWPAASSVRDFSRVVPLASREPRDTIIARTGGIPVALMRRAGAGALIFLGSPLGPALRSGDSGARQWLAGVAARHHRSTL